MVKYSKKNNQRNKLSDYRTYFFIKCIDVIYIKQLIINVS